ncbi:MAG: lysostaphin resistance A-like protein [Flavobacterium sp.]
MFLFLVILNYAVISVLQLDVSEIMKTEIKEKGETRFFAENMIPFIVGLAMLFAWVKGVHKQSITSLTTGRKKIDFGRIFFSFSVWTVFVISMGYLMYLLYPQDFVFNYNAGKFWPFFLLALLMVPIQTSFEEYLFRGYLMQGLGLTFKNKWIPLIITSILFGSMHLGNPEVGKIGTYALIYYIGTGFFLGILTLMDDGLELALGFHAANNFISALLVTSDWTAFQTPSIFKDVSEPKAGFDIILPIVVIFPALLFIFGKKYNWSDWKERLTGKIEDKSLHTALNHKNHE